VTSGAAVVAKASATSTSTSTSTVAAAFRHISNSSDRTSVTSSRNDDDRGSAVAFVATDRGDRCRGRRAPATGLLLRAAAAAHSRRTHENVE